MLLACGDSSSGVAAEVGDVAEADAADAMTPSEVGEDGGDADDGGADGVAAEVEDVGALDSEDVGGGETDAEDAAVAEVAADAADTADAADADAGVLEVADTETADTEVLPAVLTCPVASMESLYAGVLPPNPYGAWPTAPDCVKQYHDVIIVLGCPSEGNGSPASCQTGRVDIAMRLKAAGYGDRFIVTGGAVHNQWVEAEALRALLLSRGVQNDRIWLEPEAEHTDENLYYSTQIMVAQGWRSALVVSNDPGHLMMTALCDSNCCVELGRLTLFAMPVTGGLFPNDNVGHYVLIPPAEASTVAECTTIQGPIKFMCTNLGSRKACKGNIQL